MYRLLKLNWSLLIIIAKNNRKISQSFTNKENEKTLSNKFFFFFKHWFKNISSLESHSKDKTPLARIFTVTHIHTPLVIPFIHTFGARLRQWPRKLCTIHAPPKDGSIRGWERPVSMSFLGRIGYVCVGWWKWCNRWLYFSFIPFDRSTWPTLLRQE